MALTDSLSEYWKLDESSGNATGSVSSTVLTNYNTVSYGTGKINNGADTGTSNTNKYLESSSDLGMTYNASFSMAGWFKINTAPGTGVMYIMALHRMNGPGGSSESRDWSIRYDDSGGTKRLLFVFSGNAAQTILTVTQTLTVGTWYHIAGVYTSGTARMELWLNGSAIGNTTRVASYGGGYGDAVTLFDNQGGSAFPTSGMIDEIGFWNRDLSSSEISELYNSGAGLSYPFITDLSISVSDQINITESVTMLVTSFINVSDQINITESVTMLVTSFINVSDQINITESVTLNVFFEGYSISVFDSIDITESVTVSNPQLGDISVFDLINITEAVTVTRVGPPDLSVSVNDQINLTESVTIGITSNISVSDQINITESVTMFTPDRLSGVTWMRSNEDSWPLGMDDETII